MDRLEAKGYKDRAIIEIGSKRLRNTMTTFQRFYADLRTNRAQDVAQDAWESADPVFEPGVRRKDGPRVQSPVIDSET